MAGLSLFTDFLKNKFRGSIKHFYTTEPEEGSFADFPQELDPRLISILQAKGIHSLYSHQLEAFLAIREGSDCLMVSRTASGKTLSFLLPVLNEYLKEKKGFSVLMLYPTKALSRDQEGTLGSLIGSVFREQKIGTYDGDTPRGEREKIRKSADFMISNPDMLHSGILPNHNRQWKSFLSRLRFIIVDEVHIYRGVFGSHVANVFRRLLRICELHGSRPIFICSSATVANPSSHAFSLFGRSFKLIDVDGSPRPKRELYFLNPPLYTANSGVTYRKGTHSISVPLIREAVREGLRLICFCRGRQEVERLYRAVLDVNPRLAEKVKPYRGGLLPNERRNLEKDLFEGKLNAIISTNALELGINIGDLDVCLLNGHPGSVASFWQQAGRVGRSGKRSVIVYIAREMPVDQYIVNHPAFILKAPVEEAWLNPENPYIFLQHLPCAAYEKPLEDQEPVFKDPDIYRMALDTLLNNSTLSPYHGVYRYSLYDYPSKGVNLRGMTDYNIQIIHNDVVIGELDPIGARGTLYKDAIYQHLGKKFMSLELDLEKKFCRVERVDFDYYTEAVWEGMVQIKEVYEEKKAYSSTLQFGEIQVNKQPKLYKKIKEKTRENIGYGPISLSPFMYDTTGFSLHPGKEWSEAMEKVDKRYEAAAIYGLSYILKRVAPSLCMGDIQDIQTDVSLSEEGKSSWKSALYLYDSHEGGVGYAEKIYEKSYAAFLFCEELINACECEYGCPSCVTPQPPGVESHTELEELLLESDASRACTKSLLSFLTKGEIIIPIIKENKRTQSSAFMNQIQDIEREKMQKRMERASGILQRKREKKH
ncbi:MAG: DEAD/DEAH box helicase [Leptospiraceae bacterium]|nr:DEAD/DEAH box helicase [Leptospiraceae bacterium]MCP5503300.1 DEAD/DEAH box helicase [Leptospiraceae bacterium]